MRRKYAALVLILLAGFLLRSLWSGTDLYSDESDAMLTARSISRRDGIVFRTLALNQPLGYWPHPPLFILLLTGVELVFPGNPAAMRSMTSIFGVATIFVASLTAIRFGEGDDMFLALVAASILSTSYFHVVVSNILADDIVVAFLLGLSVYLFCSYLKKGEDRLLVLAGLVTGVGMLSKIGPPTVHAGILSLFLLVRAGGDYGRLLRLNLPAIGLGLLGLLSSGLAWGREQLDSILSFVLLAGTRSGAGGIGQYLGRVLSMGAWASWYFTFPFGLAVLLGIVNVFRRRSEDAGLVFLSYYTLIYGGFFLIVVPFAGLFRYFAPIAGPSTILVAVYLRDSWIDSRLGLGRRTLIVGVVVALATFAYLVFAGPSLEGTHILTTELVSRRNFSMMAAVSLPAGSLALVLLFKLAGFPPFGSSNASFLLGTLAFPVMVGMLGSYAAFGLVQGAGYLEYPHAQGIAAAGAYLETITGEDDVLVAFKDIAYYSGRPFYYLKWELGREEIAQMIYEYNTSYLAYYPPIPPDMASLLRDLEPVEKFDNTYVFNLTATRE